MARVTDAQVLRYVADCAESIIEDDINEAGMDEEEFEELQGRAWGLLSAMRSVDVCWWKKVDDESSGS